ncbi:MAG: hypothetical protein ACKOU6_03570 [Planctomycetota bacterium]
MGRSVAERLLDRFQYQTAGSMTPRRGGRKMSSGVMSDESTAEK